MILRFFKILGAGRSKEHGVHRGTIMYQFDCFEFVHVNDYGNAVSFDEPFHVFYSSLN